MANIQKTFLSLLLKKTVTIKNAGKRSASFKILRPVGSNAMFEYDYTPMCPIAPGLNEKLTVTYRCTSMAEMSEKIIIIANDNKIMQLIVYVENPTPILKCKYTRTSRHFTDVLYSPCNFSNYLL